METVVQIKFGAFGEDINFKTREYVLNKETEKYYFFQEAEDEFSELSKVKKSDFGNIMDTRVFDTHQMFTRTAWVPKEDMKKTSEEILDMAKKHFQKIADKVNVIVEVLQKTNTP